MKYSKLMNELKKQIMSGKIKPGEKLPSENELARDYEISRQTVRKALELLQNEGLVYAQHGRGTFCAEFIKSNVSSGNVAVVMTYLSNYIFPYVIRGIDEVLAQNEYSILLKCTHNSRKMEAACLEELTRKNIDGLIIEPSRSQIICRNKEMFDLLEEYRIPVVFVQGIYHGMKDKPYVLLDDCKGGYLVTRHLIEQGCHKIIGIFKADDMQGQERHKGYVKALQEAGMEYDPGHVIWFHTEDRQTLPSELIVDMFEAGQQDMEDGEANIDGVVCYNDNIAMEIISTLEQKNLRVPQDILVTGYDDSLFGRNFRTPLTTIKHPQDKMGETAAELLLKLMTGTPMEEDEKHIIMEPELIIRQSSTRDS